METIGIIRIKVDEPSLDECLRLAYEVTGETAPLRLSDHERFGELMRLSRLICLNYNYRPFAEEGDSAPTCGTWATGVVIKPTRALLDHYSAVRARLPDWLVKRIIQQHTLA